MRDEDLYEETYTTQAMFPGDDTIPPSFNGKTLWLAFQKAIDDWCDIPELDDENRGPALRNRVEGDAAIYKGILDRDLLKAKRMVLRISVDLETFLCEESVNFVLCRFQHFRPGLMSLRLSPPTRLRRRREPSHVVNPNLEPNKS